MSWIIARHLPGEYPHIYNKIGKYNRFSSKRHHILRKIYTELPNSNKYTDFVSSLAAVTLGYCDRDIDSAVKKQMKNGVTFTLPHILEMEVAEKLIEIYSPSIAHQHF